jgi:hypothetical protein
VTAVTVAGVPLEVGPARRVTEGEVGALADLMHCRGNQGGAAVDSFRLRLVDRAPRDRRADVEGDGPALVSTRGGLVTVSHPAFEAVLDPVGGRGVLTRDPRTVFPLRVTLRVALCSRLPLASMVPLHAAGMVLGGPGVVFFGPSGAGKTTLSKRSPYPVLSDELVVAGARPPTVADAGFFALPSTRPGRHPLVALVELDKGDELIIEQLDPVESYRRLLSAVMVPVSSRLWQAAMAVVTDLVTEVPVYRMAWSPAEPPWDGLAEIIDLTNDRSGSSAPTGAGKGTRH